MATHEKPCIISNLRKVCISPVAEIIWKYIECKYCQRIYSICDQVTFVNYSVGSITLDRKALKFNAKICRLTGHQMQLCAPSYGERKLRSIICKDILQCKNDDCGKYNAYIGYFTYKKAAAKNCVSKRMYDYCGPEIFKFIDWEAYLDSLIEKGKVKYIKGHLLYVEDMHSMSF